MLTTSKNMIIQKPLWYRRKDIEDMKGILAIADRLYKDYMVFSVVLESAR